MDAWLAGWPTPYRAGRAWASLLGPVIVDVAVRVRASDLQAVLLRSSASAFAVWSTPYAAAQRLASPVMSLNRAVAPALHRILAAAGAQVVSSRRSIAGWIAVRRATFTGAATHASNRMVAAAGASVGSARGSATGWIAVRRAPFHNVRSWKTLAAPVVDAVHSSGAQTAVGLGIGLVAAVVLGLFFAAPVPAASIPAEGGPHVAVVMADDRVALMMRDGTRPDPAPIVEPEVARTPEPATRTPDPTPTSTEPPPAPAADQRPATEPTPPPPRPAKTQRPAASSPPARTAPPPPATVEADPIRTPTSDPEPANERKPPKADKPDKPEKPDKPPKGPKPPKPG
jgi:hypothetical protein